jgi:hypothetical protein
MSQFLRAGAAPGAASPFEHAAGSEGVSIEGRDLFVVAKCMVPTDAYLLAGVLAAGGVPAVVADANHVQADLLIAPALGGVRILAPREHLAQAAAIIAAFERGEYALDDDADVGERID